MAYKCKSCGYRFKPSDADLCPECFTARDDISCGNFADGAFGQSHNHFKDSAGGDDFIARQLREENKRSGDELAEEIRSITDGIKRNFSGTVPPNTYQRPQQNTYQQNNYRQVPPIQITRAVYQQPRGTGYQQSAGAAFQTHRSFVAYPNNNYAAANAAANAYRQQEYEIDQPVKPQNSVRRIVAGAVFLNIIVMIVTMSIFLDNGKHGSSKSGATSSTPVGSVSEFCLADNKNLCIQEGCYGIDADIPGSLAIDFDRYMNVTWYRVNCDVSVSGGWTANELILEGIDRQNIVVYTWTTPLDEYRSATGAAAVPLCFAETQRYKIIVHCTDRKGNNGKLSIDVDLNGVRDDLFNGADDVFDNVESFFDYNYDPSLRNTSLTDLDGSGYKLKLADNPVDLTYEPEGKLSFEDDSLTGEDIRLCRVNVVGAGGRTAAAENEQALLAGFDAAGSPAYYYSADKCVELPINSRVKDYELYLTVADSEGFDRQLHFEFTSNDLYDSLRL